ncbi:Phosphoadenosine phosphosulfate reductase [subsurface metagenome]
MTEVKDVKRLRQELAELQALPLKEKVDLTKELINKGLSEGKAAVMWSGGKDSTALLHMVQEQQSDVIVLWNNTGVEFPETWPFIKQIRHDWNLNLHIARPKDGVNFWWCVERYGWPLFGKHVRSSTHHVQVRRLSQRVEKAVKVARISSYCCDWLKKKPTIALLRESGVKVQILGNMVAESDMRWFAWIDTGEFYFSKAARRWKLTPMYFWTDDDVWAYHEAYHLPHCGLYDKGFYRDGNWICHKRNGCWTCGMDIAFLNNHLSIMRHTHPKLWRFLMIEKGLGQVLLAIKLALRDDQLDFFQRDRIEGILEQRPCYFDNLRGL